MASRAHDLTVTVHDASGELGKGLAYGTTDRRHLLNVRSRHMSAFPDIPGDLVEWARRTGRQRDAQAFLPRRDYAVYLSETLDRLRDDRLAFRAERVLDVVPVDGGFELHAHGGRVTRAATVVLAHGNQRPAPLTVDDAPLPDARWHLPDPWDLDRPDRARARRGGGPGRHRPHRGRRRDHPAGRRSRPARGDGEPARPAADRARRAELHRLAQPGPDRAGHRRPARRAAPRPGRRRPAPGRRLAPGRRRAPDRRPRGSGSGSTSPSGAGSSRRTPATGRYAGTGWPPRSRPGSTATATRAGSRSSTAASRASPTTASAARSGCPRCRTRCSPTRWSTAPAR